MGNRMFLRKIMVKTCRIEWNNKKKKEKFTGRLTARRWIESSTFFFFWFFNNLRSKNIKSVTLLCISNRNCAKISRHGPPYNNTHDETRPFCVREKNIYSPTKLKENKLPNPWRTRRIVIQQISKVYLAAQTNKYTKSP